MTWQFVLTGLLIGTLVGMTGMGGGSLMTPILVISSASSRRWRLGRTSSTVRSSRRSGRSGTGASAPCTPGSPAGCSIGSAPFSLLGVALGTRLTDKYGDGATSVMGYVLGGALLFGATGLVLKSFVRKKVVGDDDRFDMVWRDRIAAVTIGVFGGFIVGLTSVGSGTFFALTMLFVFPLGAHKIVGTDILHAAALLYVAGFGHFIAGNVDFHAVGWLLIGSIPGVLIGSHYSVRVPEAWLRLALADVLAISGLKLVQVPNVYLAVAIGVSVAVGLVVVVNTAPPSARGGEEAARPGRRNVAT